MELIWIQEEGFGKHWVASCLNDVLKTVSGAGGAVTLLEEARKFFGQLFYLGWQGRRVHLLGSWLAGKGGRPLWRTNLTCFRAG